VFGSAYDTDVVIRRVVLDTNVLVAASRSKRGASAKLLSLVGTGRFEICLSVPVVLEYEEAVMRHLDEGSRERHYWNDILDFLCRVGRRQDVFFLWRPFLRDPKDDMVLELAVAGGCRSIVTYNQRDFVGSERLGIALVTPKEFLAELGEL
jgi:putative PIN family toxin of toxin-antitoxin system